MIVKVVNRYCSFNDEIDHQCISYICPYCNHKVLLMPQYAFSIPEQTVGYYLALLCPECKSMFLATINKEKTIIIPSSKYSYNLPQEIKEFSPAFVEIYSQAMQAKFDGLDKLVGMGLRKAYEQLLYDYLINVQKVKPEKGLLNYSKQIEIPELLSLSNISRWVGNDETHPTRESVFTIDEMINSIHSSVYLLLAHYKSKQYLGKNKKG